jgi:hypothetical protein
MMSMKIQPLLRKYLLYADLFESTDRKFGATLYKSYKFDYF